MKFKFISLFISLGILVNFANADKAKNLIVPNKNVPVNKNLETYKEGVDYTPLISPPDLPAVPKGKVLVQEFFSFSCPHCAHAEKFVEQFLYKNNKVMLQRIQVLWGDATDGYAKLNQTLIAKNLPNLYTPIFDEVAREQDKENVEMVKGINKPETITEILQQIKMSKAQIKDFFDTYNSFTIQTQVNQTKTILDKDNINSTPTFIVANKYLISGASPEREMQVILYLVTKLAK